MANITAEHLQHMARRHHATMKKLDGLRDKFAGITGRAVSTVEMGAGAWIGGAIEGRTGGASLGPVPINLGVGLAMVAAGAFAKVTEEEVRITTAAGGEWEKHTREMRGISAHLHNLGNGFIGSWLAATGYAFGKRWKETGKVFGGGGRPWTHPYENGWPKGAPAPAVKGDGWYDGW